MPMGILGHPVNMSDAQYLNKTKALLKECKELSKEIDRVMALRADDTELLSWVETMNDLEIKYGIGK